MRAYQLATSWTGVTARIFISRDVTQAGSTWTSQGLLIGKGIMGPRTSWWPSRLFFLEQRYILQYVSRKLKSSEPPARKYLQIGTFCSLVQTQVKNKHTFLTHRLFCLAWTFAVPQSLFRLHVSKIPPRVMYSCKILGAIVWARFITATCDHKNMHGEELLGLIALKFLAWSSDLSCWPLPSVKSVC